MFDFRIEMFDFRSCMVPLAAANLIAVCYCFLLICKHGHMFPIKKQENKPSTIHDITFPLVMESYEL